MTLPTEYGQKQINCALIHILALAHMEMFSKSWVIQNEKRVPQAQKRPKNAILKEENVIKLCKGKSARVKRKRVRNQYRLMRF
jgi:hypothetical protein